MKLYLWGIASFLFKCVLILKTKSYFDRTKSNIQHENNIFIILLSNHCKSNVLDTNAISILSVCVEEDFFFLSDQLKFYMSFLFIIPSV